MFDCLVYTRAEAAEKIGVSLPTFDKMIKRETHPMPYYKVGSRYYFPRQGFDEWCIEELARLVKGRLNIMDELG